MNPEGDHYVTRMTHTLQVTQVGRSIARALSLNVDLAEAVCLGHDVGHSPFGHTGEDALSEFVDVLEHEGPQLVHGFEHSRMHRDMSGGDSSVDDGFDHGPDPR